MEVAVEPVDAGVEPGPSPPRPPRPQVSRAEVSRAEREQLAVVTCHVTVKKATSWAYVEADGMRQGATPLVLRLEPGRHALIFMRSGFRSQARDVTLAPGENVKLLVEMAP
jgi:hypothetical protein